jgi:hypothetical protein
MNEPFAAQWRFQGFPPPDAGISNTNMAGVNAALAWLNANITPPAVPTVFGMIDTSGDVRLFWYGRELPHEI